MNAHSKRLSPRPFRAMISTSIATSLCLVSIAYAGLSNAAECNQPAQPQLPEGAKASMQDMLDGQKAVKTFQGANVEYMKCLETTFMKAEKAVKKAKNDAKRSAAETLHSESLAAYNAAVSAEEEVAGAFNTAIREYKAANK